ncbi:MAG: DUF5723 family protein [Mucilaginibacter sp.]|uniref:DUF5723 family protein n=1 Tax=Mucilaginibacter sp. TaxID=1882438 RepID=UPI0034E547CC
MKYFLGLVLIFTFTSARAQQFSHFNTGTLFDAFENPAQRAFVPDSSRQFAFNFFFPNLGATSILTGNAQASVNSLIKKDVYNSANLTNGLGNLNNLRVASDSYWFMLKMYNRLDGDQEFGLSAQTKAEGHGSVTDETLLLLDSYKNFDNGKLNQDLFNDFLEGQAYHQFSLTFQKKIDANVAFGLKLSTLLGIYYNKLDIEHSSFAVNQDNTKANLFLQGKYQSNYYGTYRKRDILGLKNPGAAVSFGLQAQLDNGLLLQGNLKDLGFIRWNKSAVTYNFSGTQNINRVTGSTQNDTRVLTATDSLTSINGSQHAFYTPINGKVDLAISKKFVLVPDFSLTPNLIVSKELFYNGLTAALVNHFTYRNLWVTALASYNQDRAWSAGGQLMYKSPNVEFYVGTEQLFQSARFLKTSSANYNSTGINAFIGFSAKFGRFIEHPANASTIPMGEEKGFFDRMWTRIFKRSYY